MGKSGSKNLLNSELTKIKNFRISQKMQWPLEYLILIMNGKKPWMSAILSWHLVNNYTIFLYHADHQIQEYCGINLKISYDNHTEQKITYLIMNSLKLFISRQKWQTIALFRSKIRRLYWNAKINLTTAEEFEDSWLIKQEKAYDVN